MKFSMLIAAGALALSVSAAAPSLAAPGIISLTNAQVYANLDNQDFAIGWGFNTTGQNIFALGYNATGFTHDHNVGIYDDQYNLLASVTVNPFSALSDGYRYEGLTSALHLDAGLYYIAAATYGQGDGFIYNVDAVQTNSATSYAGSYFLHTFQGALVPIVYPYPERDYMAANFRSDAPVPEPAAWALMLTGFLGAGAAIRRRRAALA